MSNDHEGCAEDPGRGLEQMFVDRVQRGRIARGQQPAERPVFRKTHGVAAARLVVREDLPAPLAVGVFAQPGREYAVWLRSSSDAAPTDPDAGPTLGIALKLFDVPGPKLLGAGTTCDFVFQNHNVFFVDTAADMCEFTRAGVVDGNYQPYLDAHPTTDRILKEMAHVEGSVLTATYWSVLPFEYGETYAKYKLEPIALGAATGPTTAPDYLAADFAARLRQAEHRFRFMVQLRADPAAMPIDRATVRWSEQTSPPIEVATLIIPAQDPAAPAQLAYGEPLSYNIWRVPPAHAPAGSLAEVRRRVYMASADVRRTANGTPLDEPSTPQAPAPASGGSPTTGSPAIVRAVIHPSIGIARIGNSSDQFFIGPEVPDPPALPRATYRDKAGRLARQAARFRIYGVDAAGKIVEELTVANADIAWTAHLANQKAAWFQFQLALDIPEADAAPPTLLRNQTVADRASLVIDPGPRTVRARPGARPGETAAFDTGAFAGTKVDLGELRTDDAGRLLVLGGRGVSGSSDGSRAVTFANNENWYDDTSDGPVTAAVTYGGRALDVTPAWVVVAPPNYAPLRKSVRTMWDLMRDVAIHAGMQARPVRPSFARDIQPLFERLAGLQWVNSGFAAAFGWRGPFDLASPAALARLAAPSPADVDRELRLAIANQFRNFDRDAWAPAPWPWIYGDAMNSPPAATPRQHTQLTPTQLALLEQWAKGDFDADYDPAAAPPRTLDDVPLAGRGDALDRAALEFCLADAFHPGCEMTWPVRLATMYMAPFRWKHAAGAEARLAAPLTMDALRLPDGPAYGQRPGSITRWMAVPWQTDTASCRSGYTRAYDPHLPTFWPARVPNQVMTRAGYELVMETGLPLDERLAAFASRADWTRPIDVGSYTDAINAMVAHIDWPAVIVAEPGPGDAGFPATLEVEDQSHDSDADAVATGAPGAAAPQGLDRRRLLATGAGRRERTRAVQRELAQTEKAQRFPRGLRRG